MRSLPLPNKTHWNQSDLPFCCCTLEEKLIDKNKPRYIQSVTIPNHHTLSSAVGMFYHLNLYDFFSLPNLGNPDSIWKYFFLKARSWNVSPYLVYHSDSPAIFPLTGPPFLTACCTCGPSLSLRRGSVLIPWAKYESVVSGRLWNVVSHVDCSSYTADVPANHWRSYLLHRNLKIQLNIPTDRGR